MNEFEQRLIEELISEPSTAGELARLLSADEEQVVTALIDLRLSGMVCPAAGEAFGDAVCENCPEAEFEGMERDESCPYCEGPLIDACRWIYCGGPISQAFNLACEGGVECT